MEPYLQNQIFECERRKTELRALDADYMIQTNKVRNQYNELDIVREEITKTIERLCKNPFTEQLKTELEIEFKKLADCRKLIDAVVNQSEIIERNRATVYARYLEESKLLASLQQFKK
jgi:hypothetical protein